jgi:hypothetical protein
MTNVIGAVTSNRSSRADIAPQANISAATIARSETLTISPADQLGVASGHRGKPPGQSWPIVATIHAT